MCCAFKGTYFGNCLPFEDEGYKALFYYVPPSPRFLRHAPSPPPCKEDELVALVLTHTTWRGSEASLTRSGEMFGGGEEGANIPGSISPSAQNTRLFANVQRLSKGNLLTQLTIASLYYEQATLGERGPSELTKASKHPRALSLRQLQRLGSLTSSRMGILPRE